MAIDPNDIKLTPRMREQLAELSERTGRPWPEILEEFLDGKTSIPYQEPTPHKGSQAIHPDAFDSELSEVSFEAPALPAHFSRADIYGDHE